MYNTDIPTRAELPGTSQLLRSTAVAVLVAAGLLITTILPAEYGIDPTGVGRALGLTRMGQIKTSLASEAITDATPPVNGGNEALPTGAVAPADAVAAAVPAANDVVPAQQHTMTVQLQPGQEAEIKLVMSKDARVRYEWSSAGGPVSYDTHGDPVNAPSNVFHSYSKGQETGDAGTLQAVFDGQHGWYWHNRSGAAVTITLQTRGDYEKIARVL